MSKSVTYDVNDAGVAFLTLNQPSTHNAFDDKMVQLLIKGIKSANNDSKVRVLVLQSKGKTFSAGANLQWMQRMVGYSYAENHNDALQLSELMHLLRACAKPTIAKVQGAAFGGAIGLLACCNIVICSKDSKFCLSEVKLGLAPATIAPYVIEAIGPRLAQRYMLSAEVFDAPTAKTMGLISELTDINNLEALTAHFIQLFLANAPQAMTVTKNLISLCSNTNIDDVLRDKTAHTIATLRVSDEGQAGLNAFLQKQPAPWVKNGESL